MTTTQNLSRRSAPRVTPWQERLWKALRHMVLAGFVALAVGVPLQGRHQVSYGDLLQHLKSGGVREVMVEGALVPGSTGYSHPLIVWKDEWITRESEVLQVSDSSQVGDQGNSSGAVVTGDLATELHRYDPSLRVQYGSQEAKGLTGSVMGWATPHWIAVLSLVLLCATLGLIQGGPEPRFATRWAWAWFALSPLFPLAALAYLALTPGRRPDDVERKNSRRITGGWSFLLVIFFLGGFGVSRT